MVRIVFLHPDLGIGGAERLVIDAALALKSKGHHVSFITPHHSKNHCFQETSDGTFSVTVVGDWLPRSLCGRFYAAFAYLRMIVASLYLVMMSTLKPDIIFCDQVSACIPVLKLFSRAKVLFYCHFPDQLLTKRTSIWKTVYRWPIDWLEEITTGMADVIMVNSRFTDSVFRKTFKSLSSAKTHILHPSLNTVEFDKAKEKYRKFTLSKNTFPLSVETVFLSINRFERKKNLPLALRALADLKQMVSDDEWNKIHLAMAGGYDENNQENVDHFQELQDVAESLGICKKLCFFKSVSNDTKMALLKSAVSVIYTPNNEHFGIVPLEAMYMEKPVIAMRSGGPLETIIDNQTGFLCEENPQSVADAMLRFIRDPLLSSTMGSVGRDHVQKRFSFQAFTSSLDEIVTSIL